MISLVKHVLVKKISLNSSVLNYPETCVSKIIFLNSSVFNYRKTCVSKKKKKKKASLLNYPEKCISKKIFKKKIQCFKLS